ncbi:sigma-70 family RNA polymerase sigma factor [Massilia sp. erpn]|uniref:sigma-70 family RNA polymerase sigma factor n=1 Tax=Massilia sp. erpn TaxID=2738142 RepID=UPI0021061360|nr:sigma-70 family RNA polymerase sigma factor [Massilia sp. erpn]UTY59626.1 sigma-70 family RNA polymerase sigma factor [Massilia sp. erpn]
MSTLRSADPQQLRSWLFASASHDALAFRSLYDATAPKLFGFALRILRKRELAEEALQDSFITIWHAAGSYQSHLSAPMTWMSTIVRNKALDILRRLDDAVEIDANLFDSEVMQAMQDQDDTPDDALELSNAARSLAHCLSTLEAHQRQAIGMAFLHELSHSEVALQLTLPIGTVKTWIRRGLEKLKVCLARRELP